EHPETLNGLLDHCFAVHPIRPSARWHSDKYRTSRLYELRSCVCHREIGPAILRRGCETGVVMSNRQVPDRRFRFGDNWLDFARSLSANQLSEAERSLRRSLERDPLAGLSFLDIGSGSGLFSLAARKLGARVHSFDFDEDSVLCTARLRERYVAGDSEWRI